tara:strand:- start:135563 stop:135979 length:417 start_codon:yes stop_codon:yes gene_type:complete
MTATHDVTAQRRTNPPTYETIPVGWIKTAKRNARKHSAAQVDEIVASMKASGVVNPPIVDENYRLIAGEGRYLAIRKMGVATVEVIVVRHLTEEQKRAYAIADTPRAGAFADVDLAASCQFLPNQLYQLHDHYEHLAS